MSTVKMSKVQDPTTFGPSLPGTTFVAEMCCSNGHLSTIEDYVVYSCEHADTWMRDGAVQRIDWKVPRQ